MKVNIEKLCKHTLCGWEVMQLFRIDISKRLNLSKRHYLLKLHWIEMTNQEHMKCRKNENGASAPLHHLF